MVAAVGLWTELAVLALASKRELTAREAGSPRGEAVIFMVTTSTAVCANHLANSITFTHVTRHWRCSGSIALRLESIS